MWFTAPFSELVSLRIQKLAADGDKTIPGHEQHLSLLPIGIVGPQLPLTLLLHPRLIHLICWKWACTRVFQQRQLSTENVQKIILSVLSWAGDVYSWQWRAMGPGDQRH